MSIGEPDFAILHSFSPPFRQLLLACSYDLQTDSYSLVSRSLLSPSPFSFLMPEPRTVVS